MQVNISLLELKMLVKQLLGEHTDMPADRAKRIANTVKQKIEYIELFQEGKKIWKREKYW